MSSVTNWEILIEAVASTQVQIWGTKRRRGWVRGAGVRLPAGDGYGGGANFLLCDLEMAYFGEF